MPSPGPRTTGLPIPLRCCHSALSHMNCLVVAMLVALALSPPPAAAETNIKALDALLNSTNPNISLASVTGTSYFSLIAASYGGSADRGPVFNLLAAQQRWRRGANGTDGARNFIKPELHPYDCQPTYVLSKERTSWFHVRYLTIGLCFTVCLDSPYCTTTTPLVLHAETAKPMMLLRCGFKGADCHTKSKDVVELRTRTASGSTSHVCRNAVDRSVGLPNVTYKPITGGLPPGADRVPGISVQAFGRNAKEHGEELVLSTHDLWAHWELPMTCVQNMTVPSNPKRVAQSPSGADVLFATSIGTDWFSSDDDVQQLRDLAPKLMSDALSPREFGGLWVMALDEHGFASAHYTSMRPDLGGRWYSFHTFGGNGWGDFSVQSKLYGTNGMCKAVLPSLYELSSDWDNSTVATKARYCDYLETKNITSAQVVGDHFYNGGTVFFSASDRATYNVRCPVILNRSDFEKWGYGCGRRAVFTLNQFGGPVCQGANLFTTPAIESRLYLGTLPQSYTGAMDFFLALQSLQPTERASFIIDAPGKLQSSYYTLADAALRCNISNMLLLQSLAVRAAMSTMQDTMVEDAAEGAIIVAFTQLLIATLTVPLLWSAEAQETMAWAWGKLGERMCSCFASVPPSPAAQPPGPAAPPKLRRRRIAFVGLARFVAAGIIVVPTMLSFISVTAQGIGTSLVDGYPAITYRSMSPPPCANGGMGVLALGIVEVATMRTEVQTWAVALVCCISLLVMIGVSCFTMWKEFRRTLA